MKLLGTAVGIKVTLKFAIEDRGPDGFLLHIGMASQDSEIFVRIGTWATLQKTQDVADRIARQTVMAGGISWREPDQDSVPPKSWKDALTANLKRRALRSRRPCPVCGGLMRYVATITTLVTRRRLRMCASCGHSDPKPVWVHSA